MDREWAEVVKDHLQQELAAIAQIQDARSPRSAQSENTSPAQNNYGKRLPIKKERVPELIEKSQTLRTVNGSAIPSHPPVVIDADCEPSLWPMKILNRPHTNIVANVAAPVVPLDVKHDAVSEHANSEVINGHLNYEVSISHMKIILRNDVCQSATPVPARMVQALEPKKQEWTDRWLGILNCRGGRLDRLCQHAATAAY